MKGRPTSVTGNPAPGPDGFREPRGLIRHAPDLRAELRELLLDGLVAAIDVVDALDLGASLGYEAREHQARGGAQVGGHYRRGGEFLHAVDDGRVPLETDFRSHAAHFQHVHETVL